MESAVETVVETVVATLSLQRERERERKREREREREREPLLLVFVSWKAAMALTAPSLVRLKHLASVRHVPFDSSPHCEASMILCHARWSISDEAARSCTLRRIIEAVAYL
jgi:hypothetical protein